VTFVSRVPVVNNQDAMLFPVASKWGNGHITLLLEKVCVLCPSFHAGRMGEMLDLDSILSDEPLVRRPKPPARTDLNPKPEDLPSEWHFLWDERAAIMEYDGELPRERAEALALTEIVERMRQEGDYPCS
jgi:hypothetical protein